MAVGILYWIVRIGVVGVIIGGISALIFLGLRKYVRYFKDNQKDCVSALASLSIFAIATFVGSIIKSIISINLVVVMIVMFVVYSMVRWVGCMENTDLRRDIVIWSVATIWVGMVLVLAWKWYGVVLGS